MLRTGRRWSPGFGKRSNSVKFRRLRLAGFKSFVDPTELRIEDGLTGVVGPNGCGKSNLLEAIRWVMGESSPKSLRGGGMEDVIFAGTETRPSRDFAAVTLSLDNPDRTAPAQFNDGTEIEVVRRIERGLGSAYRINGRDMRQKDVQLLFADAATGAHSPALVSQGRIGAIISAKPQERRLMLEEAAGIAGLHVRRKDAEQKLRAAEVNLTRLDDVLQGMEVQAAALRRQAKQAERYRALSDRIRIIEAQTLFARWREAAAGSEAATRTAADVEARLVELTRAAAILSARQADAAADLPALRLAEAEAAAQLQLLVQTRQALTTALVEVERRQAELIRAANDLARDQGREATFAADSGEALAKLAREDDELAERIAASVESLAGVGQQVAGAELAASENERALDVALAAHADAQAGKRAAETALAGAQARQQRIGAEAARLGGDLADAEALDTGGSARATAELALASADQALGLAAMRIEAADTARDAADGARQAASGKLAEAQGYVRALLAERDVLVRRLAQSATGGGAHALDLLRVAAGYEKALAAALGDDLSAGVGPDGGPRRWAGAVAAPTDPKLPDDVVPLAARVEAPAELARRLRQVGVIDGEPAAALIATLAVGQRIVSRDGRLWRWDGFAAHGGGVGAAAERLEARNRLAAVESEVPGAESRVGAVQAMGDAARHAYDAAASEERAARDARGQAEGQRAAAQAALADLAVAEQRRAARIDALRLATMRAVEDASAASGEVDAARVEVGRLADIEALGVAAAKARLAAEGSRATLATARAEQAGLVRTREADAARRASVAAEHASWERRQAGSIAQVAELAARAKAVATEQDDLSGRPAEIAGKQTGLAADVQQGEAVRREAAEALANAEAGLRATDSELRTANEASATAREERARTTAQLEYHEERRAELNSLAGERFQCPPVLLPERLGFDEAKIGEPAVLAAEFERLTVDRERIGPVNLRAEVELADIELTAATSAAERAELETAIARLRGSIGSLNREGRQRLLTAFEAVDAHFRRLFETLFGGGQAHLELIDSDDPLEAGLEIMAQPPGKRLQSLTLLSGGEQALTAIALIFALFLTNPAPICVLDEVDAPLDDANVERFCDLLDRMCELTDTRFLIVTHNAVTMARMHRLFGITMAEKGVSQLVSVDLARANAMVA